MSHLASCSLQFVDVGFKPEMKLMYSTMISKNSHPPDLQGLGHQPAPRQAVTLHTAKTHDYFPAFILFLNNKKKKQALCLQRTSFLCSILQISRGRVRFSAHQIPEKAQFFQVVGDHE